MSAYFLGGFGEDGRGMNGQSKAVSVAAKSWAVGIPVSRNITQICIIFYSFGFLVKNLGWNCFPLFEREYMILWCKRRLVIIA